MRVLILLLLTFLTMQSSGQVPCRKTDLIGGWDDLARYVNGTVNTDSLLANLEHLPAKASSYSIYFRADGTYFSTAPDSARTLNKGVFMVGENCLVGFGKKPGLWHILLLNEKFLVFRYRNPKAEFVSVYRRKM